MATRLAAPPVRRVPAGNGLADLPAARQGQPTQGMDWARGAGWRACVAGQGLVGPMER